MKLKLPEKCVFAFLGGYIEEYAAKVGAKQVSCFVNATKNYPVYVTEYKGEEIVLCQAPVGAAAAVQLLDWLIGYGVREIISAGSCGALEQLDESVFLVPRKALRDEGTSYHYAPPLRFIEIDERARKATWGMILYTADCLANVDQYDERNWGGNAYEYALALCLDAVLAI